MNPTLKFALELGPIIIWVVLGRLLKGVETDFGNGQALALMALLVMTIISVTWLWMAEKKVPWLPLVSALVLIPMGVLSLVTGNPNFVMIKPTIMWVGLAAVFTGFMLAGRNLFKLLLGERMPAQMPDAVWNSMAWRYIIIFLLGAVANEGLRFIVNGMDIPPEEMLVPYGQYKLFVVIGVMILSMVALLPMGKYLMEADEETS
jgi:intracellular septation protein